MIVLLVYLKIIITLNFVAPHIKGGGGGGVKVPNLGGGLNEFIKTIII